jgi:hypothetical protein
LQQAARKELEEKRRNYAEEKWRIEEFHFAKSPQFRFVLGFTQSFARAARLGTFRSAGEFTEPRAEANNEKKTRLWRLQTSTKHFPRRSRGNETELKQHEAHC